MKTVSMSGSPRENVGKKDAARLRREGLVPAVVYGGDKQIHISLNAHDVSKLVYTPNVYKVELEVGGDKYETIVQEMQFHPVTEAVLHADFLQLFDDKEVKVKLPVVLNGSSIGVRNGGKLGQNYRRLSLFGLPNAFPEAVEIDVTDLKIGDLVRVSDITFEGVTCLEPANAVIVGVKTARGAVDEEEEEEGEEAPAEEAAAE